MAIGGSTNAILHIPAIARKVGISLRLDEIDRISRSTSYLAALAPSGPYAVNDFHRAGGVPAVLRSLGSLVVPGTANVAGSDTGSIARGARWENREIIRSMSSAHRPDGGVSVLWGSLAPQGALVKKSGVDPGMWTHEGPAMVFDSMEEAAEAVRTDRIVPGSVMVIRYEGPSGGPGMREMHMITSLICGMDLDKTTALVTDPRFSGSTRGPCVGYVSPEAAAGGPIALVEDGDRIAVDIPGRKIELKVSPPEMEKRNRRWYPAEPKVTKGLLAVYAKIVSSASDAAVLK